MDTIRARVENSDIPDTILTVAFQPTARGGPCHFVTGNIRVIKQARSLLSKDTRQVISQSPWMAAHLIEQTHSHVQDNDWIAYLESELSIKEDITEEQLVVDGQSCYPCPVCKSVFLI